MKPGGFAWILGNVAVVVGIVAVVGASASANYERAFYLGALLIFGGLLLRIEAAISAAAYRNRSAND